MSLRTSVLAVALSSIVIGISDARAEVPLKVGLIAPMSGDLALYGNAAVNGMRLGADLPGPAVSLLVEDNRSCGAADAVPAAQKLISVDKVDVLVTVCTGAAQGVLPIAKAQKIPLFQLTESGPDPERYMIKLMPDSVGLVDVLAEQYIKEFKKLALLGATIQVNTGERGNLILLRQKFESLGGEIVFYEEFSPDVQDFRSIIGRVRRSGAEAVTPFLGTAQQMTAFLKQSDELRLWSEVRLAGNFFFEFMLKELLTLYPRMRELNGLISSNLAQRTAKTFISRYEVKFGEPPAQFADYAYDAMSIIKRCGLDPICHRQPFDGASGRIAFDLTTDRRIGEIVLRTLQGGEFVDVHERSG